MLGFLRDDVSENWHTYCYQVMGNFRVIIPPRCHSREVLLAPRHQLTKPVSADREGAEAFESVA
jgi:hypothetical protein